MRFQDITIGGNPRPYHPTFSFPGEYVTPQHRAIGEAPRGCAGVPGLINLGIEGFLWPEEALKLYELAYCGSGDVLELGTHKGLSTSILAGALEDRGSGNLETVDIDEAANQAAQRNVLARPGGSRVTFTLKDATIRLGELQAAGRVFGLIFVDHWHGYAETAEAAKAARAPLLAPGGFVMFHDFLDPGNIDPDHVYGVYDAVRDTISEEPPNAA